jgi:hypothetical protein
MREIYHCHCAIPGYHSNKLSRLIIVHIFIVYATIFLFTLHVSTLMVHHQVLSVTHGLLLNYNVRYIHLLLHI